MARAFTVIEFADNEAMVTAMLTTGVVDHVTFQADSQYTAYGLLSGNTHPEQATIAKSGDGYLVAADQSFLDLLPAGDTLINYAENNPNKWHSWYCALQMDYDIYATIDVTDFNYGILIALGKASPKAWGLYNIVGTKAAPKYNCGQNMIVSQVPSKWYGDYL